MTFDQENGLCGIGLGICASCMIGLLGHLAGVM